MIIERGEGRVDMPSDRMFRKTFPGLDEREVLEYMDRLLAIIEGQKQENPQRKGERRESHHEFLVYRMRKSLEREGRRLCRERRRRKVLLGIVPLACLLAVLAGGRFWMGAAKVTGESMSPFLRSGDVVIYSRRVESYERGALVVCDIDGTLIVKRTAAIPGDFVQVEESGRVRIESDGEMREAEGASAEASAARQSSSGMSLEIVPRQIRLKGSEYFLLGDNREMSVDSRTARIGPVDAGRIEGRVLFVIRRVGRS